ncbi:hypothetical protein VPH35_128037 [Triticum aestivum]
MASAVVCKGEGTAPASLLKSGAPVAFCPLRSPAVTTPAARTAPRTRRSAATTKTTAAATSSSPASSHRTCSTRSARRPVWPVCCLSWRTSQLRPAASPPLLVLGRRGSDAGWPRRTTTRCTSRCRCRG